MAIRNDISEDLERDMPGVIPLFPLSGALLLPRAELPLNIFEPRYLKMVHDVMNADQVIGMIQPRDETDRNQRKLYSVGCAGKINAMVETGDGRVLITLEGISRFEVVEELSSATPYRQGHVSFDPYEDDQIVPPDRIGVDRDGLIETLTRFLKRRGLNAEWAAIGKAPDELLVNSLAMISPFSSAEKQALLEADSLKTRAETMMTLMEFALAEFPNEDDEDDTPVRPN